MRPHELVCVEPATLTGHLVSVGDRHGETSIRPRDVVLVVARQERIPPFLTSHLKLPYLLLFGSPLLSLCC